jgi:hypothetical protein
MPYISPHGPHVVDRLTAMREPSESYSDVIVRIAAQSRGWL